MAQPVAPALVPSPAGPPADRPSTGVLPGPGGLVERPRLLDVLDDGVGGPLTLVTGQAGAGKTVLVRSWLAAGRAPGPVLWVSFADVAVPDGACAPDRAPRGVLDAVRNGLGLDVARLVAGGRDGGSATDQATGPAAEPPAGRPAVLVLDDLPPGGDPDVLAALTTVLVRRPAGVRVLVTTRADPPLPHLTRHRVSGDLTDVRAADLAFTTAETADLLRRHGIRLPEQDLALLCERTEGWAAGLRLAALWLQHAHPPRAVADFAGTDRTVADYLVAEVLDQQPEEVRDVLLRTSVLTTVSGPLADALTGRDDGDQVLDAMERTSTFVAATDAARAWYRYHPLFRELLRFELRHRHPQTVPLVHARAAGWLAEHGRPAEALRHAVDAGAPELLADLLVRWGFRLVVERDPTLPAVLHQLPARVRGRPALRLLVALDALERGEPTRTGRWEPAADARPGSDDGDRLLAWSAYAEVVAAARAGRTADVRRLAAALLGSAAPAALDPADREAITAGALVHLGTAEAWEGRLDDADAHLHDGVQLAAAHDLSATRVSGLAALALVCQGRGSLHAAERAATAALALAAERGMVTDPSCASARLALAMVHLERDETGPARQQLAAARELVDGGPGQRRVRTVLAVAQAMLHRSLGETAAGRDQLARARREASSWPGALPVWLADWLLLTECELCLQDGDSRLAGELLDQVEGVRSGPAATALPKVVLRARVALAGGDPASASALVRPWLEDPRPQGPPRPLVVAWLLDACACAALGDRGRATRCLERALDVAAVDGFRRAFAEGGAPVRSLLVAHLGSATAHRPFVTSLLDGGERAGGPHARAGSLLPSFERLTDRERAVARYLPSRLSAGEIAAELHLSVHTVKSHLRHVYRKLGATSRREAVDRARQSGLL